MLVMAQCPSCCSDSILDGQSHLLSLSLKTVSRDVVAPILAWCPAPQTLPMLRPQSWKAGTLAMKPWLRLELACTRCWSRCGNSLALACGGSDVFGKAAGRKGLVGTKALKITQAGGGRRITLRLACVFLAESD